MSKSPNRMVGVIFGVVYLVIGVFGFFITSGNGFAVTNGPLLIGLFEINSLHNLVNVVIGAALLIAGLTSTRVAKGINGLVGTVFLLLGIAGLFLANGTSPLNILALNSADNVLHFASAVVLLAVGIGADKVAPEAKPS